MSRLLLVCILIALAIGHLGVPPATAQAQAPDPRFGVVEAYVNAQAATEAGVGYTRVILRWDVVQPGGPGDWKPANVPDPFIEAELAAGRQVVGLLMGTPAWAAADPATAAQFGARAIPNMDHWKAFVSGMAAQYRGRIHHWIVWNEPDVWDEQHMGSQWAGSEEDYFRLLKTAYLAIKEVDPEMQVTLAGLTYFWDWTHGRRQYLDRLLDVIAADPEAAAHGYYFDAVVYHLYFKPLQTLEVLAEVHQILQRHGIPGKQIWINETNAPPSDDPQELPWSEPRFRISLQEQAAFVIQEFALAFAGGATRVEFYKMRNSPDHPESIEPFGLLRADDSRRPAFAAYQVATTYLRDFRTARLERVGNVWAVTFDRGEQTTTVLWTTARTAVRARVRAIAAEATLVDEQGATRLVAAKGGAYELELPGATCSGQRECLFGGAPRLLVEHGLAGERLALPAQPASPANPRPTSTQKPEPPRATPTRRLAPS